MIWVPSIAPHKLESLENNMKLFNDTMQPLPVGGDSISKEYQFFVSKNSTKYDQVVSLYGRPSLHKILSYCSITMSKS